MNFKEISIKWKLMTICILLVAIPTIIIGALGYNASKAENIRAKFLESWIPERVGVKRAITSGGVPGELVDPFKKLWNEVVGYLA